MPIKPLRIPLNITALSLDVAMSSNLGSTQHRFQVTGGAPKFRMSHLLLQLLPPNNWSPLTQDRPHWFSQNNHHNWRRTFVNEPWNNKSLSKKPKHLKQRIPGMHSGWRLNHIKLYFTWSVSICHKRNCGLKTSRLRSGQGDIPIHGMVWREICCSDRHSLFLSKFWTLSFGSLAANYWPLANLFYEDIETLFFLDRHLFSLISNWTLSDLKFGNKFSRSDFAGRVASMNPRQILAAASWSSKHAPYLKGEI